MMKNIKKSGIIMILLTAVLLSTSACGGNTSDSIVSADTVQTENTNAEVHEEVYDFGTLDLNGAKFTILNSTNPYSFYDYLDFENVTGDMLDDSIYQRNRTVEDKYNFVFNIDTSNNFGDVAAALQTAVLANEDIYDVVFIRDYYLQTALTEGYLRNLDDSDKFNFNKPWWDSALIENFRIGKSKKALFAQTDVSLVDFEGTIVTFFNEDMMANLNIETPYQLVRDGKWTFDKMIEYQKAAASLNGDEAFVPFSADGNAVYGHVGFEHSYNSLLTSAGINYVTKDSSGNIMFGLENEKFYNAAIRLSEAFAPDGEWLFANTSGTNTPGHYEMIFKAGRSLLMTGQLKATNNYRDMESNYGIVPVPKWTDTQDDYINLRTFSYVMCVPVTNSELDAAGQIMDAMSYITYTDIMPYFYDGRMSQKNLRNEESIEMLDIIRSTRYTDIGMAYGMYTDISTQISNTIKKKSTDFASMVASIKPKVDANIENIMNAID